MKIKDHFLSQETFEVKPSIYPGILETVPQPSEDKLADYYDSEEYVSHQTQAKTLKDKVYKSVKSLMIKRKRHQVLEFHKTGNILDIGAGTGDFLEAFEQDNWRKFAIEPSDKLHTILKQKQIQRFNNLIAFEDDSFEIITLWHSLEHIPNLEETLLELKRILKPNGIIFIAVPNHKSYDAKFYKTYWAAWDVPRHLWHFSRTGLKKILLKYEFNCIKEKAMPFDSYYVSLLSESYKPNGLKARAFYIGCLSNLKSIADKECSSITYVLKHYN